MKHLLALRDAHWDEWERLLGHPFLHRLRGGEVSERSVYAWMEQNYRFVEGLLELQARLVPRAPRAHRLVLAHGLVGIVEDLDWMAIQPINPGAPAHPARERYLAFLRLLDQEPYPVSVVALWTINRVFHDAWSSAAPSGGPFVDLVEHWTAPEFHAYLHDLAEVAEEAWLAAGEAERQRVHALVGEILRLEWGSWDMAQAFAGHYG
ncbi:transcriptional activator, tena family [Oceanithermus profundus]|uniref:Transcriptional activator, TenA family n=1 Tax=Oceanithermus profundus (strain DSM 14977 / NBRC 100410 / VKM B-2274 / 506) TaxID=670487 RepID=E4U5H0_OCEP5|nr:transcriptional activator, tena family [Oceanithermus profundus]ADR35473.1 transcriptional activator, TenA family [Oceanithermus profundus DSM 14977]